MWEGLSVWQENKWYNVYLLDKRIVMFCRRKLLLEDWVRNLLFSIGQDLTSNGQSQILEISKSYIEHSMTYYFLVDVVHLLMLGLLSTDYCWSFLYESIYTINQNLYNNCLCCMYCFFLLQFHKRYDF